MAKNLPKPSDSTSPIANAGSPSGFNPNPTVTSPADYKTASRMSSIPAGKVSNSSGRKDIDYSPSAAPSIPKK